MKTCGGCDRCCELVAVGEIRKPGFTVCPHQRAVFDKAGPGCDIYAQRPHSCRSWSCGWLLNEDWPEALRPNRCGVVVDPEFDLCAINGVERRAAQIWVGRGYEEAFQDGDVFDLVMSVLQVIDTILWRLPPADGKGRARALMLVDGKLGVGPITETTNEALGGERARIRKLLEMEGMT